ncbi:MAG: MFS transporter [Chloroflexota bacterium]
MMRKFFYGYWIVAAGFVTLTVSNGLAWYGFSVMNTPVAGELGWSRSQVSLGFTFLAVAMAVISPFVGRLTDNRGPRQVLIIGTVVLSLSLLLLSRISSLWSFCLLHAGLGMASALLGPVPISVIISNWFRRLRGTMQGISFIGIGFGGVVFGPLIGNYLIPNFSWQGAYMVTGLLSAVIMTLVILFLVRNHPQDKGLTAYGAEATETAKERVLEASKASGLSLKEALGMSAFWLIALTFAIYGIGLTGSIQNLVSIVTSQEFTAGQAAFIIGIVGLFSAAGKFAFGYLSDKIDPKYNTAIAYALTALSLITLALARSIHHLWLYAILVGLGMGGWAPNTAALTANYFGLKQYGSILGTIHMVFMAAEAAGPALVALAFERSATYHSILIIISILCAVAIPLIIIIKKPRLPSAVENTRQT